MKLKTLVTARNLLLALLLASPASAANMTPRAVAFVNLLAAQKFPDAVAQFDARMTTALPTDKLQTAWQSVTGQLGTFQKTGETKAAEAQAHTVEFVEADFERGSFWVQIAYDEDGKIGGLHFLPKSGE